MDPDDTEQDWTPATEGPFADLGRTPAEPPPWQATGSPVNPWTNEREPAAPPAKKRRKKSRDTEDGATAGTPAPGPTDTERQDPPETATAERPSWAREPNTTPASPFPTPNGDAPNPWTSQPAVPVPPQPEAPPADRPNAVSTALQPNDPPTGPSDLAQSVPETRPGKTATRRSTSQRRTATDRDPATSRAPLAPSRSSAPQAETPPADRPDGVLAAPQPEDSLADPSDPAQSALETGSTDRPGEAATRRSGSGRRAGADRASAAEQGASAPDRSSAPPADQLDVAPVGPQSEDSPDGLSDPAQSASESGSADRQGKSTRRSGSGRRAADDRADTEREPATDQAALSPDRSSAPQVEDSPADRPDSAPRADRSRKGSRRSAPARRAGDVQAPADGRAAIGHESATDQAAPAPGGRGGAAARRSTAKGRAVAGRESGAGESGAEQVVSPLERRGAGERRGEKPAPFGVDARAVVQALGVERESPSPERPPVDEGAESDSGRSEGSGRRAGGKRRRKAPWEDGKGGGAAWGEGARRKKREGSEEPDAPPPNTEARAREICLRMLAGSPRTRAQLSEALKRKGISDDVAEGVLSRFADVGLIDDAAFAEAWVRSRHAGRGLARRALAAELRQRGVDSETVSEAVEALDGDQEEARARELVERKLRSTRGVDSVKRTRRLVGMLARKGYPPGLAYRVVRDALEAEGADVDELGDGGWDG